MKTITINDVETVRLGKNGEVFLDLRCVIDSRTDNPIVHQATISIIVDSSLIEVYCIEAADPKDDELIVRIHTIPVDE